LEILKWALELAFIYLAESLLGKSGHEIVVWCCLSLGYVAVKSYRVCRVLAKQIIELAIEHEVALGWRQFVDFLYGQGTPW